jgi:hypothetical protein
VLGGIIVGPKFLGLIGVLGGGLLPDNGNARGSRFALGSVLSVPSQGLPFPAAVDVGSSLGGIIVGPKFLGLIGVPGGGLLPDNGIAGIALVAFFPLDALLSLGACQAVTGGQGKNKDDKAYKVEDGNKAGDRTGEGPERFIS